MARRSLLARPVATLAAGLLVAGLVQTAPASADVPIVSTGLSLAVTAVGLTGGTESQPADLGVAPGAATLDVRVTNDGPDDVAGLTVVGEPVANGTVSVPECDLTPLPLVGDVSVLGPGASVTCSASVSGVAAGSTHRSTFTASGTVGDPATPVSGTASFAATASEPAPVLVAAALAIAAPASAVVGSSVAVSGSLTRGGQPYAATAVLERQVDGSTTWAPVTTVAGSAGGVLATTVTADRSASYRFRFAGDPTTLPVTSATARVEVVKGAAALTATAPSWVPIGSSVRVNGSLTRAGAPYAAAAVLERQADGAGAWTGVATVRSSSTGALSATAKADRSARYRYRFPGDATTTAAISAAVHVEARKQSVTLTASAPTRAVTGTTITVKGSIKRAGAAYRTTTQLQRQVGDGAWTTLKNVKSSSKGALSATVKADRSAGYRYRYAGTSTIAAGTSNVERVSVAKATVRLSVNAPASVTKGKSIKVKGTIKRQGKGYRTTTVLQFSTGDGWSTVKKVKSSSKGALSTSVRPSRSGEYRYRFVGNSTTAAGESGGDRVTVKPKPPAKPKPRTYKNCTELTKVYPHGVGRSGAVDRGGDVTDFVRDTRTYDLNKKSDRDKDGIACER